MERFLDPRVWMLLAIAIVWAYRARLAIRTLGLTPSVDPNYRYPDSVKEPVSVIIPVKNEEKNIRDCILSLLRQDYPNLEIIVINDGSTDQTEAGLKSLGAVNLLTGSPAPVRTSSRIPLRYLNATKTPAGWTGKNFAIHSGISYAKGSWFFFTDADTRYDPSSISAAIAHAESRDISLLTLHPRCLAHGFFENLIQPAAMGYLGLWFPAEKINDPESDVCFANGQFLLIKRSLYEKIGGHQKVAGAFLEDFAMMKDAKGRKERTECAFGTSIYGTRMYESFRSIWQGWRRIYLHAFEKNAGTLMIKAASVFFFSVFPYLYFPALTQDAFTAPQKSGFLWGASIPILLFILAVSWKTYGAVKAKRLFSILMPVASFILTLILIDASRMAAFGKETKWR